MALESYMYFKLYDGNAYSKKYLPSESRVEFSAGQGDNAQVVAPFKDAFGWKDKFGGEDICGLFEVEDYSFDIEQILSIGSQSSGSGAGKVTFNPFSITRKVDCASPFLFAMSCSGTPFETVGLGIRKSAGNLAAGVMNIVFTFKLVAVKTLAWAHDDEAPKETVTFEYGALNVDYAMQKPDGTLYGHVPRGWNRVRNTRWDTITADL